MNLRSHRIALLAATAVTLLGGVGGVFANHAWGNYHWARTSNPFTLKVVDSVTSAWDAYLTEAKNDWSASSVLDLTIEPGSTGTKDRRLCRPSLGKIRACNYSYGPNGWVGIAQIWISGDHIAQATTQMNDTYFNTSYYNTPAWRRLVMCQEIGHDFGLDHQDVIFNNPNLGSCMDYTDDPDGTLKNQLSNEHPNQHDYDQLETIYAHLDTTSTVKNKVFGAGQKIGEGEEEHPEFGTVEKRDSRNRPSRFVKENHQTGETIYTFVIWAD